MSADEFAIIRDLFAPLATDPGARGLLDDAAVLESRGRLVITADALVEGVHFRSDDALDKVAQKALRANLSDLAAKASKPVGVLLSLIWPDARPAADIAIFARGFGEDLRAFGVSLLGGDMSATPGPLTIAITAFGAPAGARIPARADAKLGDDVWVSGSIGDAWLGFAHADAFDAAGRAYVLARLQTPTPRLALAPLLAEHARGSIDLSDGLAGDAAKIGDASGVLLRIDVAAIPFSPAGRLWAAKGDFGRLLDWGDDYEILFTADPQARATIETAAAGLGVAVARIGTVTEGAGAVILGPGGAPLTGLAGHAHRLGAAAR